MKGEIKLDNTTSAKHRELLNISDRTVPNSSLRRMVCSILAAFGIFGGISSLFAGSICVVIHSVMSGETVFDQVGTALLIIAVPMILIGSILLDEIERR